MSVGDEVECKNNDRELWREHEGDYYADSLFVTEGGRIGMNCGGYVIVMPIRNWFNIAKFEIEAMKLKKQ